MNILVVEDEPKARNDLDGLHLATVNLVRRHRARRDDADNE